MEAVRVCDACFVVLSQPVRSEVAPVAAPEVSAASAASSFEPRMASVAVNACKCGMPLCVCVEEPDSKVPEPEPVVEKKAAVTQVAVRSAKQPVFASRPQLLGAAKNAIDWKADLPEQCRDAIKSGDLSTMIQLLDNGVSIKYVDRQNQTLLHLAAMFNRTDMCLELLKRGADPLSPNAQGESPIDVAPPSLAHKMRAAADARTP